MDFGFFPLSGLHETDHDQRAQLLECLLPGGGVVSEIVGSVLACYSIILTPPPPAAAAWPRLSVGLELTQGYLRDIQTCSGNKI